MVNLQDRRCSLRFKRTRHARCPDRRVYPPVIPWRRLIGSFSLYPCIGAERGAPSDSSPLAMGAGSSKRVHPEAAFHAADTDKDGKLTSQELGAIRYSLGQVRLSGYGM